MTTHICTLREQLNGKFFDYCPYNPKLTPSVYHLFLTPQEILGHPEPEE
jgi:hypothetical protein